MSDRAKGDWFRAHNFFPVESEEEGFEGAFDYLISTTAATSKLKKELSTAKKNLKTTENKIAEAMWREELNTLENWLKRHNLGS